MSYDLATVLIWTLRILLPVILFCIYFKLQSPKEEAAQPAGRTDNLLSRDQLLAGRRATIGAVAPQSVANITLKSQDDAPALFAPGRTRGRGDAGGRPRGGAERGDRDRQRSDGGRRGDREKEQDDPPEAAKEEVEEEVDAGEEQMHMAALLNYVAFNRRQQQRVFLPDVASGAPPPPPPPRPAKSEDSDPEAVAKANVEVQMVLRGAKKFKRAEVTAVLFEMLSEQQVEIQEDTFALMIEACVLGNDVKLASDFLVKMDHAGHIPSQDLLDKVMDVHAQHKAKWEHERREQEEMQAMMMEQAEGMVSMFAPVELDDGSRARLNTDAPAFVPSFGDTSKLSTEAAPFVPTISPAEGSEKEEGTTTAAAESTADAVAPSADTTAAAGETRTKLKDLVSAKSFEPIFGMGAFDPAYDPYMYSWPTDADGAWGEWGEWGAEAGGEGGSKAKNGKGQGKGKGKGKGKDGSKGGDNGRKPQEKAKAKAKAKVTSKAEDKSS